MEEQYLFLLAGPDGDLVDGVADVRPSVWMLSAEELEPLVVTVAEAARVFSVSVELVDQLITSGRLPTVELEGHTRIRVADLARLVVAEGSRWAR